MDGMLFALIALVVAGLASVLGIWMERDASRPPRWAIGLSVLIIMATVVSIFQSVEDARGAAKMEDDMARMLQTLDKLSNDSPELTAYLNKEMEAQSRSNPDVINKVAKRVTAEGGNANEMLSRHLPAGELSQVAGDKGQTAAAPSGASKAEADKLKAQLAQASEKAAAAEAAQKELQATLDKNAEAEKEAAEKVKALEAEVEKLEKKLKAAGGAAGGATRWGKG